MADDVAGTKPAQPLASCSSSQGSSLPFLMAKRSQVATRHAAHRIASHRTKPFSSQWAAALSRTIYQQRFSCRGFSLSLSLTLSAETRDTNGRRQQQAEEEDEAEAIRSYRQAVRNERDSCEMPGNVAYAIFLQPSFLRPHRHARIACEERLLWQRQKG